jgi:NTP pyrophosphatase (non-canonical NTP hydrolase)
VTTHREPTIQLPEAATMADFQRYVDALERMHGWDRADLVENGFLMGEEFGELIAAMRVVHRKLQRGDRVRDVPAEDVAHVGEEIVDVLNYLLAIANRLGIDVDAAFRTKNARNQQRTWDD